MMTDVPRTSILKFLCWVTSSENTGAIICKKVVSGGVLKVWEIARINQVSRGVLFLSQHLFCCKRQRLSPFLSTGCLWIDP